MCLKPSTCNTHLWIDLPTYLIDSFFLKLFSCHEHYLLTKEASEFLCSNCTLIKPQQFNLQTWIMYRKFPKCSFFYLRNKMSFLELWPFLFLPSVSEKGFTNIEYTLHADIRFVYISLQIWCMDLCTSTQWFKDIIQGQSPLNLKQL